MIPVNPPVLFGRSSLVSQVHDALARERVVLLVGPPGVGKSAVARSIAYSIQARQHKQVCWVRLVGVNDREEARARIRHAIESTLQGGEPVSTVEQALSQAPELLLVLDGAENCLELLAREWGAWWSGLSSESLTLLVTARKDPRLLNARLLTITPLPTSPEPTEEVAPAVAWFFHCAQRRGWALAEKDSSVTRQVERIVTHLGGNPTAIELAASRGKIMGLSGLESYLQRDLSILEGRLFDVSSRQSSFVHMLEQGWSALDEIERVSLAMCSAFHASFRIEAFAALAQLTLPEAFARVEALVERGLVRAAHQGDMIVFDVIAVMRQFVKNTDTYRALPSDLDARVHTLCVHAASEVHDRGTHEHIEVDEAQLIAWLMLAECEENNERASMLLELVFRHSRMLAPMYGAHDLIKQSASQRWSFTLLCMARRFEMLYTEQGDQSALDLRQPSMQELALDALDPLTARDADPYGPPLRRASLLMKAGQLPEAQQVLEDVRRGWGGRKEGPRAGQLDLLTMEHMIRTRRFPLAKRLVRTRYVAMRACPGAPLWDEFVSAALLLELLGALEHPAFQPERLKMTWHAGGLDLDDRSWRDKVTRGSYLDALSGLLDWVSCVKKQSDGTHTQVTRRERLVALLTWTLRARSESKSPDMKDFHALASVWRESQAGQCEWFDLLVCEGIEMCLRHERLHSVATQLHSAGTLVTIDMQSNRFRVGNAEWVSFGHRPKAKLLIEYMIRKDERGEFPEVQADELINHIWPDENMRYDSALARLYNLIANLRRLGLSDVLVREKEGYRLSSECVVQVLPAGE